MPLVFTRIQDAVAVSRMHLTQTSTWGTEAEGYLAAYLVVLAVSEFEDRIEKMVVQRAAKSNDNDLANFVKRKVHQGFRTPDFNKISEVAKHFSTATHDALVAGCTAQDRSALGNLMTARHALVHNRGAFQMSFAEVEAALPRAYAIMESLVHALGLDLTDVARIMQ